MRPALLALFLCSAGPALAETLPFEGKWDCEVGTFTFTGQIYDPGGDPMDILDATQEDGVWVLTFADDYQISLEMNADGTMGWYSPISGDSFLCKPLP